MKIRTAELTGLALNWAVGFARTLSAVNGRVILARDLMARAIKEGMTSPSTDWAEGGPIIERGGFQVYPSASFGWCATQSDGLGQFFGPTPLIAVMRCYVASQLGDEVDVPDNLVETDHDHIS